MDITKIILTPEQQKAFDKFTSDTAELTKAEFEALLRQGIIKNSFGGKSGWFDSLAETGICELNDAGKSLRAYQAAQTRDIKKNDRRYWITTGIAVAALITAIVSIVLQYL